MTIVRTQLEKLEYEVVTLTAERDDADRQIEAWELASRQVEAQLDVVRNITADLNTAVQDSGADLPYTYFNDLRALDTAIDEVDELNEI